MTLDADYLPNHMLLIPLHALLLWVLMLHWRLSPTLFVLPDNHFFGKTELNNILPMKFKNSILF
jgi:hypothetical protein